MKRVRAGLLLLTLLASLGLAVGLAPTNGWTVAEERWLDVFIALRAGVFQPPPLDPRIRLIGIDEDTIHYLAKPSVFWDEDLGLLTQGLVDAGAAVVGLDYVSNVATENLSPSVSAEIESSRVPLLKSITTGKVLLVDLPDAKNSPGAHPHPVYFESASQFGNIANGITVPGSDGMFRRILALGSAGEAGQTPALALRAVSLLTNQPIAAEGGRLTLGGVRVPIEAHGNNLTFRLNQVRAYYPYLSAATILKRLRAKEKLEGFQGTLCLIGPQALSFGDLRATALDKLSSKAAQGGTLGLELHAAAVEGLLAHRYLVPYSWQVGAVIALSMAASLFYLGFGMGLSRSLILAVSLEFCYFAVALVGFLAADLWLPYLTVVLSSALGYSAGYLWRYLAVDAERRRTRALFSKMVAPQVVERVLSDPRLQGLGGHHRRVTVLYTDINDFTPVCERHTPAEVIVMLNSYFDEMVRIIFLHEGMLKQFVGDEIMVIYGAPADQPDHAARAVSTALDMQDKLAEMLAQSGGADGFFDIKIGIHTGDVVVGHVGAAEHMEYAAVGDDVNLGARIMATTKKVGVKLLVSRRTKEEAEPYLPDLEWFSQGVHSFKGKTAQMEIFGVRRRAVEGDQ